LGFAPKNIKINTHNIEIDCECGKPNTIENTIGCEGIKGKKLCNIWKHKSCAGNIYKSCAGIYISLVQEYI
jgi:hypothetical protein